MKKYTSTIAAFLLIIAAIWNITCEIEYRSLCEGTMNEASLLERRDEQAQFQYYLHINSKPYKQSLKMDTLFAQRLDSIERQAKVKGTYER